MQQGYFIQLGTHSSQDEHTTDPVVKEQREIAKFDAALGIDDDDDGYMRPGLQGHSRLTRYILGMESTPEPKRKRKSKRRKRKERKKERIRARWASNMSFDDE